MSPSAYGSEGAFDGFGASGDERFGGRSGAFVRHVAAALSDPARQAAARTLLRQRFAEPPKVSLKTLLASAPHDGIDLDRTPDLGRDVEL